MADKSQHSNVLLAFFTLVAAIVSRGRLKLLNTEFQARFRDVY